MTYFWVIHSVYMYSHAIQTLPSTEKIQHFLPPTQILWNPTASSLSHHCLSLSKPQRIQSSFPPEKQPHNYITITESIIPSHPDLSEMPLKDSNVTFLAHGIDLRDTNGKFQGGYAITSFPQSTEFNPYLRLTQPSCRTHSFLPLLHSSSRYLFDVVQYFSMIWKQKGFTKALRTSIKESSS